MDAPMTPGPSTVITGSCLCGGVRFEVDPPFIRAGHCDCSRCRKHSGTFGLTQARVSREQFRLLKGGELIRVYGKGEGAVKAFCTVCGSSLFGGTWPDGAQVSIRMGAFDTDPGIRPQFHTYVASRAPWDEIADNLPQFEEAWHPLATGHG
jgi:hypothetical protein